MILALAGQFKSLSHMHLNIFQVTSTGFEPTTSVMPVQCSYQVNYEAISFQALISFLTPHFTKNFFPSSFLSRENTSPTNWPSQLCSFIAQLIRAGFESRWSHLKIFQMHMTQLLKLSSKREDHLVISKRTFYKQDGWKPFPRETPHFKKKWIKKKKASNNKIRVKRIFFRLWGDT